MRRNLLRSLFTLCAFVAATFFVATATTSPGRNPLRLQGYSLVLAAQTARPPAVPDPAGDCLMRYARLKAQCGPQAPIPENQFASLCETCRQ